MASKLDLLGKKFGKLTVIEDTAGHMRLCRCDCGKEVKVRAYHLTHGEAKSCGCSNGNTKHGFARGIRKGQRLCPQYTMWLSAKRRARDSGAVFSLQISDICIPTMCPLLGIPLQCSTSTSDNSPSLDRLDNTLGYIPSNVWVISYKANRAKGNLSLEELILLVKSLEKKNKGVS